MAELRVIASYLNLPNVIRDDAKKNLQLCSSAYSFEAEAWNLLSPHVFTLHVEVTTFQELWMKWQQLPTLKEKKLEEHIVSS